MSLKKKARKVAKKTKKIGKKADRKVSKTIVRITGITSDWESD